MALAAKAELSKGTNCDSDDLENTIELYFFKLYMDFGYSLLTMITIFAIKKGYFEIKEGSRTIWPTYNRKPGLLIKAFAMVFVIFKYVWFVMFLVAYSEETQLCLDDDDEVFDAAHDFLKAILIVEAIPVGITILIFLICLPVYIIFVRTGAESD